MTAGYLVTVTIPGCGSPCGGEPECERVEVSRQTVDTLGDPMPNSTGARKVAHAALAKVIGENGWDLGDEPYEWVDALGPDGGEYPLPDGSTLSVERVEDGGQR